MPLFRVGTGICSIDLRRVFFPNCVWFCEGLSIDAEILREVPFPTALTSLGRNPEAPESSASPHPGSVIRWEVSHTSFSLCCSGLRADLYAFVHSRLLMGDSSSSNQSEVRPSNHPPYGGFPLVSPHPDTTPSNGGVNWRSRLLSAGQAGTSPQVCPFAIASKMYWACSV